jgi:bifunctional non-homologous end joining protein LigD
VGLEGVIAKRKDSPYEPGERSGAWQKFKMGLSQESIVGG